jgi:hypothetical protein
VVGVIDAPVSDVAPDSQGDSVSTQNLGRFVGSPEEGDEYLVVAGLRLPREYASRALQWPLAIPLRIFFSNSSWTGRGGPPDDVERAAFAQMGQFVEARRDDVRFVAPSGDTADRLRMLFSEAPDGRRVVSDATDTYLVVIGSASCGRTGPHHGEPCPDFAEYELDHP